MRLLALGAAIGAALAVSPAMADQASAVMAVRQMTHVVNVMPDNGGNLWVMVDPAAGVPWNQFGAAACMLVAPHHARIFQVKVVDSTSVHSKLPRDWRQLAAVPCSAVSP